MKKVKSNRYSSKATGDKKPISAKRGDVGKSGKSSLSGLKKAYDKKALEKVKF